MCDVSLFLVLHICTVNAILILDSIVFCMHKLFLAVLWFLLFCCCSNIAPRGLLLHHLQQADALMRISAPRSNIVSPHVKLSPPYCKWPLKWLALMKDWKLFFYSKNVLITTSAIMTLFCQSRQNYYLLCAFEFGSNDFSYIVSSTIAMLFVGPTKCFVCLWQQLWVFYTLKCVLSCVEPPHKSYMTKWKRS